MNMSESIRITVKRDGEASRPFAAIERETGARRWLFIRVDRDGYFSGKEPIRDLIEGIQYAITLASGADYQVHAIARFTELVPEKPQASARTK